MGKRKRQQNDDTLDDPFEYSPNNEKSLKHDPVEIEPVFFKQTPTTSISIEKIPSLKSHGLLHILTYNIFGWKKNKTFGNNFSRVVKLLRESDADIIGLQEVIRNDKLEKLAKELNMDYIFAPAMSSDFGNALLTRFPIAKYSVHELKVGSHEIRSLICAQIKVANILLHVNVTHLDVESESTRLVQLKKIFDFVGSQPHLLVGDFNSLRKQDYTNEQWELITKVRKDNAIELPKTDVISALEKQGYSDCWSEIVGNSKILPTCRFDTRVDYIWRSKNFYHELKTCKRIDDALTSDHFPIILGIKLKL